MFFKTVQQVKRALQVMLGFTLLLAGFIMLFTPGPGWPTIFAGLAVLAAAEIVWARRLMERLKHHGSKLRDAVMSPNNAKKHASSAATAQVESVKSAK